MESIKAGDRVRTLETGRIPPFHGRVLSVKEEVETVVVLWDDGEKTTEFVGLLVKEEA